MWMGSPSITPFPVASPFTPPTVCWLVKKKNFNVNVQDLTCGMKYDENIEKLKDLHVWRLEAM